MKVEDLHKFQVRTTSTSDKAILFSNGFAPVDIWCFDVPEEAGGYFDSKTEALKAAALFRAAYQLKKELRHLVLLIEPLEKYGGLNIPGLATLNGARAALELSENTNETP